MSSTRRITWPTLSGICCFAANYMDTDGNVTSTKCDYEMEFSKVACQEDDCPLWEDEDEE